LKARTGDTGGLQRYCSPQWGENSCSQSSVRVQAGRHCEEQQKGLFKYVNSKRRIRNNIGLLLDEIGHLTNREVDKMKTFNAFFTSVFNTDVGLWDPWGPVLEDCDLGGWSQLTLSIFETCSMCQRSA